MTRHRLDSIDRQILAELQADGRMLSFTACVWIGIVMMSMPTRKT